MQTFYGTKNIAAKPMTRGEYNEFRGWQLPEDEGGDDEGYLVEYLDGGKPNVDGYAGYVSWSPKEQFENAYQPTNAMSFGHAIVALKEGKKVARAGWNGKGMFLWLNNGSIATPLLKGQHVDGISNTDLFGVGAEGTVTRLPNINMQSASGATVTGWLASQTDMLADDWVIV